MTLSRFLLLIGSLAALLAVAVGAFGAHALQDQLSSRQLVIFQTANRYHFYHALGLLVVGIVSLQLPASRWWAISGGLLAVGLVVFSGSLYLLALGGPGWLGAITPVGGLGFILGWAGLGVGAWLSSD